MYIVCIEVSSLPPLSKSTTPLIFAKLPPSPPFPPPPNFESNKFLVKILQFGFLVMTEKNIFVSKLFLLNISDFSLLFM